MYFDTAETAVAELAARVAALEAAAPVDLTQLQADVATVQTALSAVQTAVTALDARLDAISAGAAG